MTDKKYYARIGCKLVQRFSQECGGTVSKRKLDPASVENRMNFECLVEAIGLGRAGRGILHPPLEHRS